jgi:phosphatidylserine synthase
VNKLPGVVVVVVFLNTLNADLNLIWHFLALLGVHHILYVSRIRVKALHNVHV